MHECVWDICVCIHAYTSDTLHEHIGMTYVHTIHYPLQVKLLWSLGLRSTLITDGSKPLNLFNTAQGLLGAIGSGPSNPEEED